MTASSAPRTIDERSESPHAGARCRYCHAPIFWRKTQAGKWQPMSVATGQPHFAACQPYLDAHRPAAKPAPEPQQEAHDARPEPRRRRQLDADGRPWYDR